jgi:hypothetical protein
MGLSRFYQQLRGKSFWEKKGPSGDFTICFWGKVSGINAILFSLQQRHLHLLLVNRPCCLKKVEEDMAICRLSCSMAGKTFLSLTFVHTLPVLVFVFILCCLSFKDLLMFFDIYCPNNQLDGKKRIKVHFLHRHSLFYTIHKYKYA